MSIINKRKLNDAHSQRKLNSDSFVWKSSALCSVPRSFIRRVFCHSMMTKISVCVCIVCLLFFLALPLINMKFRCVLPQSISRADMVPYYYHCRNHIMMCVCRHKEYHTHTDCCVALVWIPLEKSSIQK